MLQKIVVTWNWANYESSGTETICLLYESPEAFLVHIDDAIKDYIVRRSEAEKAYSIWQKEYEVVSDRFDHVSKNVQKKPTELNSKHLKDAEVKCQEVFSRRPPNVSHYVKLGGHEFDLLEFVLNGESDPPNVYTLDEWFNSSLEVN